MAVSIVALESARAADRDSITAPLGAFSAEKGYVFDPAPVVLALRENGETVGGLIGAINWSWLHIEVLAVPTRLRGTGQGRRLVERAEAVARDAGCTGAWVDTFTFQAPGFYRKLGYSPFGELPNYPGTERRIFFSKRLEPQP